MTKTSGFSIFDEPTEADALTTSSRFKFAPTFVIDLAISTLYVLFVVPTWAEALRFGWRVEISTLVICLMILSCYVGKVLVIRYLGKQGGDARTYVRSSVLVTDGPYGYSRHPTYAMAMAQCLLWSALALHLQAFLPWRPELIAAALILPTAFFLVNDRVVMPAEEAMLRKLHPEAFDDYARCVRRWFGRTSATA